MNPNSPKSKNVVFKANLLPELTEATSDTISKIQKLQMEINNLPAYLENQNFRSHFQNFDHAILNFEHFENDLIFVTNERKYFIKKIFDLFINALKTGKAEEIIINGSQGIGKSVTLLFLTHFLRTNHFKNQFKIIYIPDCSLINDNGWDPIINEVSKNFPEINDKFYGFKPNLDVLWQTLKQAQSEGIVTILCIDQINYLKKNMAKQIVEEITSLPFKIKIISQSSNNGVENVFKWKIANFFNLFSSPEFQIYLENFNVSSDNEKSKIEEVTGRNPREAAILLLKKGASIEEKICQYKLLRKPEIISIHKKFLNSLSNIQQHEIRQAIHYLDKNLWVYFPSYPCYDKQWMTVEEELFEFGYGYKFCSVFPLVGEALKENSLRDIYDLKLEQDFYSARLNELQEMLKKAKNPGMRGNIYEEWILTTFEKFIFLKEKLYMFIQPTNYFNSFPWSSHGWESLNSVMFESHKIERIFHFRNLKEVSALIQENPKDNFLFKPFNFNYEAIDSVLSINKNSYAMNPTSDAKSLITKISPNKNILAFFQVKANLDIVFDEYNDIVKKWKKKKEEITKLFKTEFYEAILIIICQAINHHTMKKRESFKDRNGEDDLFMLISDEKNLDIFGFH